MSIKLDISFKPLFVSVTFCGIGDQPVHVSMFTCMTPAGYGPVPVSDLSNNKRKFTPHVETETGLQTKSTRTHTVFASKWQVGQYGAKMYTLIKVRWDSHRCIYHVDPCIQYTLSLTPMLLVSNLANRKLCKKNLK